MNTYFYNIKLLEGGDYKTGLVEAHSAQDAFALVEDMTSYEVFNYFEGEALTNEKIDNLSVVEKDKMLVALGINVGTAARVVGIFETFRPRTIQLGYIVAFNLVE